MLLMITISSASAGELNADEDQTFNEEIAIGNGDSINLNENNEEINLILNTEENGIATNNENDIVDNNDENIYIDEEVGSNSKNSLSSSIFSNPRNITVDTKTFSAIQSAVDSANDGDTIILSGAYTSDLDSYYIVINKTLDIIGINNAILKDSKQRGIFNISSNVLIKDITFKDGWGSYGGAIHISMGGITCVNCTFINNSARNGGAIYIQESNVSNIENCTFINNSAYRE